MDVLVQQLMKILLLLTGITTTVVVGSAYVENNPALSTKVQSQDVDQQSVGGGVETPNTASPQSPLPPGTLEQVDDRETREASISNVRTLQNSGPSEPPAPGLISGE